MRVHGTVFTDQFSWFILSKAKIRNDWCSWYIKNIDKLSLRIITFKLTNFLAIYSLTTNKSLLTSGSSGLILCIYLSISLKTRVMLTNISEMVTITILKKNIALSDECSNHIKLPYSNIVYINDANDIGKMKTKEKIEKDRKKISRLWKELKQQVSSTYANLLS